MEVEYVRKTNTMTLAVVPLLWVRDMDQALWFYEHLGFVVSESWKPEGKIRWCRMQFHTAALMLQQIEGESNQQDQNLEDNGIQLYFITDDVDTLYCELSARGIDITPPKIEFYGMKQAFVSDPDGRTLCFESLVPP